MIHEAYTQYLLCFYVPTSHLEIVKDAIFAVGAGRIGDYQHCAWQTLGEGQFIPLPGSDAFIGKVDQLEKVPEYKVEIVCTEQQVEEAVEALKKAHPYESPAYQVFRFKVMPPHPIL